MRRLLLPAVLLSLFASGCGTPPAAKFDFSDHLRGKSLLFVGAHPDDEWGVAPLFAEACLFNGAKCHFVVAAEAKSWGCLPTIGLRDPDECTRIRRDEMRRSASALGGEVTFFGWEDAFYAFDQAGMERNIALWARDNGGRAALVARLKSVLETVKPDVVFSHDPRHGTTCHPNHRAVTLLMLEALSQVAADRPEVWFENDVFVEEILDATTNAALDTGAVFPWPNDRTPMYWYDASKLLPDGRSGYDYLVQTMKTHRTQYPDVASGKRRLAPPPQLQRIPFTRLLDIDPRKDLCTALSLERPTFDKVGYPPAK
jgi:LmbE family N-acetylglucosaminyl deacetylase